MEKVNSLCKWAVIFLLLWMLQGCGMVQGVGDDIKWAGKAGEAALIDYGESLKNNRQ